MAEFTGTKRQLDPMFTAPVAKSEPFKNTSRISESSERPSMSTRSGSNPEETRQRIELRAYELYEQRGREDGRELDDWLRAEQEVTSETIGSQD
ncbi:MAG TPA: DUF2934 domain-containing protein [Candidatus Acidoferrales bacterium]|nr:DUF2934 domain-containing protein [Candidatus Acidoferrales bacterium]